MGLEFRVQGFGFGQDPGGGFVGHNGVVGGSRLGLGFRASCFGIPGL